MCISLLVSHIQEVEITTDSIQDGEAQAPSAAKQPICDCRCEHSPSGHTASHDNYSGFIVTLTREMKPSNEGKGPRVH